MDLLSWLRPDPPAPAIQAMDPALTMTIAMLKPEEGCKLVPYRDGAGVWTIGWGTTQISGVPVTASTAPISQDRADQLMAIDVAGRISIVRGLVRGSPLPREVAAFTSFAYNEGMQAFRTSTLLARYNAGDKAGCAAEFPKWDMLHDARTHLLVVSPGLQNRRAFEQAVFLGEKTP